jgi:hypothetical protein
MAKNRPLKANSEPLENDLASKIEPPRLVSAICREPGCENLPTVESYCRAHYIKNWQSIKQKQAILQDGKLRRFIEDLLARYPIQVIQAIRQDLSSNETFERVRDELGLHYDLGESPGVETPDLVEEVDVIETIRSDELEPKKE